MSKKISVFLFAALVLLIPVLSILSPYKSFSEQENRVLASFPVLNFDEFTSKRFMSGFDSFVSDHIFARDGWMALKAKLVTLTGKRDNKGVYLGNGCLIQNIEPPDPKTYKPNIEAVNRFAKQTGKPVFLLIAPTAAEIERQKLPAFAKTFDQSDFIRDAGRQLRGVKLIDPVPALSEHKSEYVYYRTDHHWTSLGAYYAYQTAAPYLGFRPLSRTDFTVEHAANGFEGTLYSKSGFRCVKPDVIDFYHPKTGDPVKRLEINTGSGTVTSPVIYFRSFLQKKDKYSAFFDGNQPLENLTSKAPDGKKLLVFKDSYAHSLVPFLANHYSKITMIDLRYLTQSVSELVDVRSYDAVLFVYNVDTFNTDASIQRVG